MGEYNFSSNKNFIETIKKRKQEIQKLSVLGFQEYPKFKQLQANLTSYLELSKREDLLTIAITKQNIENLESNYSEQLVNTLNSDTSVFNNCICLDSNLQITEAKREVILNSNEARRLYTKLSTDYVIFLLHPQIKDISYFIDGIDFGEPIFYTTQDYLSYEERKTVDKINELFEEYQKAHLKLDTIYTKFFVKKAHLKSLYNDIKPKDRREDLFINEYKQLLNNKPENIFRDDLKAFLEQRMKASFLKEPVLEDKRRLDIHFIDELGTARYLIEVKWVGTSVHANGKTIGTAYKEEDINPNAVLQTIGYLQQLHNESKIIKLGYLVVFDARGDENANDTVTNFDINNLENDLKLHYPKYRKVPDFKVVNYHPS